MLPATADLEAQRIPACADDHQVAGCVDECHWRLGRYTEAHRSLDRALKLERTSCDRRSQGRTLNVIGLLAWDEGDYDYAIESFRRAGAKMAYDAPTATRVYFGGGENDAGVAVGYGNTVECY